MSRAQPQRGGRALSLYTLLHRSRGLAEATLQTRQAAFRRLLHHCGKPASRLTRADVARYLEARRSLGVAATTQATELSSLRAVCRVLVGEHYLRHDPTEGLSVGTPQARPRLLLSEGEVAKLLAATEERTYSPVRQALSLRDRSLLELLYGVALRASEAARLATVDLDLQSGLVAVRRSKQSESRVLPLPRAAVPHLERYLREGRPVLAGLARSPLRHGRLLLRRSGLPLDVNDVGQIVRRISKRVDIPAHAHAFRRAVATHLVKRGVSLECVRQILGHVELENTARYVQLDLDDLRKAVGRLPRL